MENIAETFVAPVVSEKETIEYFSEGLKQAASAARELAIAQNHPVWADIALLCMEIRLCGLKMATDKSLGRQKMLQLLDDRETIMPKTLADSRPPQKPKFLLN